MENKWLKTQIHSGYADITFLSSLQNKKGKQHLQQFSAAITVPVAPYNSSFSPFQTLLFLL